MQGYKCEALPANPQFDLELFLTISQEKRIGGEMMDLLAESWNRWRDYASVRKLTFEEQGYLVVWLGETVENEVDERWENSPADAYMYNALAQVMCMGLLHSLVPEVEDHGCAAAPQVTVELARALEMEKIALLNPNEPGLERRYSVLTYYPFKGSCEVCSMKTSCPKGSGKLGTCVQDEFAAVTLPGHVRIDPFK